MNKTYRHLFFDLDHTLWDFDANAEITLRLLFERYDLHQKGVPTFEEFFKIYNIYNDKLWQRFRNGYIKREELRWKRLWLTFLEFKILDTQLAHDMGTDYLDILPTQKKLMPHAEDILLYCHEKGYQLHIISNGFESTQKLKLKNSGIDHFFKHLITSEQCMRPKPHPSIFEYAMGLVKAQPEDVIMIGDALEIDILGAKNMGWDQVYYNPSRQEHTENPSFEIADLNELKNIL